MSKRDTDKLFEVICPEKFSVYLDKERFKRHILKCHPDLALRVGHIQETIISPDEIHEYTRHGHDRIYWKRFEDIKEFNNFLKIPVSVKPNTKTGMVKSAIPVAFIGKGNKVWPK